MAQVLLHLGRASGAVDADDGRFHGEQCSKGGADLGTHQHATSGFHRHLHLNRYLATHCAHGATSALHRRLDLQQVHAGFDEQQVDAAFDQGTCVFFVGVA